MATGEANTIGKRIESLQAAMREHGIDAYILSGTDPHQSEQPALHWRDREWISGFTGSAGTIVVTKAKAGLWTDGRYTVQAKDQLQDTGIEFFLLGDAD